MLVLLCDEPLRDAWATQPVRAPSSVVYTKEEALESAPIPIRIRAWLKHRRNPDLGSAKRAGVFVGRPGERNRRDGSEPRDVSFLHSIFSVPSVESSVFAGGFSRDSGAALVGAQLLPTTH